jgi:nitroreductase
MLEVIAARRSIRRFLPLPVERHKLDEVLEAGRRAPSAVNLQPTRVLVVDDPAGLEAVRGAGYGYRTLATAPVVLVGMADLSVDQRVGDRLRLMTPLGLERMVPGERSSAAGRPFRFRLGEEVATLGVAVAMTYMDLQANALGLGSCWWHHAEYDEIRTHFRIPEHFKIVSLLALGYPDEKPGLRPRPDSLEWRPAPVVHA